jgi:hypothetical protein
VGDAGQLGERLATVDTKQRRCHLGSTLPTIPLLPSVEQLKTYQTEGMTWRIPHTCREFRLGHDGKPDTIGIIGARGRVAAVTFDEWPM